MEVEAMYEVLVMKVSNEMIIHLYNAYSATCMLIHLHMITDT